MILSPPPANHYAQIRGSIDLNLTPARLPDSIIAWDVNQGAAEAEVKSWIPNAEDYAQGTLVNGVDVRLRINVAAILLTASRICISVPQVTQQTFRDIQNVSSKRVDPLELSKQLEERAYYEIITATNAINPVPFDTPALMDAGPGGRGDDSFTLNQSAPPNYPPNWFAGF